jgi:hypothetical protein
MLYNLLKGRNHCNALSHVSKLLIGLKKKKPFGLYVFLSSDFAEILAKVSRRDKPTHFAEIWMKY